MKQTYTPTEADRLTGENVRRLRRLAGETLIETIDRSGLDLGQSSLSRVELGQRPLSLPEATKLAAHWNTTADKVFVRRDPIGGSIHTPPSEQEWLGNDKPPLFAVPDLLGAAAVEIGRTITIDLDNPIPAEQYRQTVWLPYLEARFANEQKAG